MQIRQLTDQEFDERVELSMYAFQYELAAEEMTEVRSRFKPEETWGVFIQNRLAAQLTLIPLQIYLHGKTFSMGGIASVSTWPEFRRQGLVAHLLTHAMELMKENGQTISFLTPFAFDFYRKYGWETYIDYKRYEIETALFPKRKETGGHVEQHTGNIELLSGIYEEYASCYNGTLRRTKEWWETSVFRRKKGHAAVYFQENGTPGGYMLYQVKQRELTIHEFVFLDEEARQGLWTFLANHDSMVDKAIITAPVDDALPFLLPNPRIKQEIIPYFMARIVDVKSFLEQYPFQSSHTASEWVLDIKDEHAPWNNGHWHLIVTENGKAAVNRWEHQQKESLPILSCDIQTLTAMMIGYQRPKDLQRYSRLIGKDEQIEQLEAILSATTTYLLDFF